MKIGNGTKKKRKKTKNGKKGVVRQWLRRKERKAKERRKAKARSSQ
jgi:hypothetical protein